ncbi:MAG: VCBS repeat-containing protein, partial [Deltaproteobacteria bacterium]|nr:VCBS repeat-containing protein [Deltaproteobacteria bacterium]
MKFFQKYTLFVFLILLAALTLSHSVCAAAPLKKVLILPFKINAPQDLTYIQEGLLDMLGSRLSWEGRVVVLDKLLAKKAFDSARGEFNSRSARETGRELGADYILFGSLTVIGQSVSLDASMISQTGDESPITLSSQAKDLNGVVPQINSFAEKINREVFHRSPESVYTEKQAGTPSYRRHPDSLLKSAPGKTRSASSTGIFMLEEGFWRSPSLPIAVTAVDVGDIDGDKTMEVVYASSNKIFVAKVEQGRLQQMAVYNGRKTDNFLTLDVADINGNGRAEIFVNNHTSLGPSSFILEWANNSLATLVKNSSWYYRIVSLPTGPALIGQEGTFEKIFYGPVRKMTAIGSKYVPGEALDLPQKKINALNFAVVHFPGEDQEVLMLINAEEQLHILELSGTPLWEGQEGFGGSVVAIHPSGGELKDRGDVEPQPFYIPPRILVADTDGDGEAEVLISRAGRSSFSNFLPRFRRLKPGSV